MRSMRFVVRLCLLCQSAVTAQTSSSTDDWHGTLQEVRRKVVEAINRSDNYICVQDLSRFYYSAPNAAAACRQPPEIPTTPLRANDRLKFDVAVSEGAEIYSWHGEHKFSAGTIGQLVRRGPITSGTFNGYLRNVFGSEGILFTYRGKGSVDGVALYHFDYQVPLAASHYQVQAGKGLELVPFHGSFSARADSFDLYSMVVTANGDEISKRTNVCGVKTSVTYQVIQIAKRDSLLPKSFDLVMGTRDFSVTESKGIYSECREYTGDSTVRFDDVDPSREIAAPTLADLEPLKGGIRFQIALHDTIDEDSTYVGQPVEAVLVRNAKIGKGRMLQRGAQLKGTVTGLLIYNSPAHRVLLNVEFSSIVDGRDLYTCKAVHEVALSLPRPGSGPRLEEDDEEQGTMVFNTPHLHLDKSFTSLFVTVNQSATESN